MKILRAVGFGIAILILQLVMSETFAAFEATLQQFFSLLSTLFQTADRGLAVASDSIITITY